MGKASFSARHNRKANKSEIPLKTCWKGGLKALRQAQLPKWRGSFKWQIEARIEALQTAYATLRAEAAKEGG